VWRDSRLGPTILASDTLCVQPEDNTLIDLHESVSLTFALRYLNNFCKARPRVPVQPAAA
jgi:hypothetical protein